MSLVDLKSDLSKYRSEVSKEGKSSPEASSATNDKNFATQQPITDSLYKEVPKISKPKVVSLTSQLGTTKLDDIKQPKKTDVTKRLGTTNLDNIQKPVKTKLEDKLESTKLDDIVIPSEKRIGLEDRLSSTKLDDIVQNPIESLLINAISQFSPAAVEVASPIAGGIGLEQIESKFSSIRQTRFSSRLNGSDIEINPTNPGQNNNRSDTDITRRPLSFERDDTSPNINRNPNDATDNVIDPKTNITKPPQSFNREDEAVVINKNILSPIGNITNPLIAITRPPQFFDRTGNSIEITKNINDALDNIVIPDIEPLIKPLSFDRQEQVPNIITETVKEGLVVNPNINVLRVQEGSIHTGDGSQFNIDNLPFRFVGTSELEKMIDDDDKGPIRYEGQTIHDSDNSQFNLDGITPTFPAGRHEKPQDSLYSVLGLQEVNFFSNQFAIGFNQRQQLGDSKYIGFSQYVWTGASDDGPFTNYFADKNAFGFQIRVNAEDSAYQPNTSQYDFAKITGVNYFDGNNINTLGGFSVFAPHQITEYKTESSLFSWAGNRVGAPQVNFFDVELGHTKDGFTKFAELGQSSYIQGSSYLDWDGNSQQSPSVNFFDLTGASSTMGFHNFAAFMDSKYVLDASNFVWKGIALGDSPEANYFDQSKAFTNAGFHRFAQKFDSKYITDSSEFGWDGSRSDAPAVNYFDLTSQKTFDGFTSFVQPFESLYIPDSSRFTWIGTKENAPFVNYLDISAKNATSGFDIFVPFLETKYIKESSLYTWNTNRQDAPAVNYFDLQNQFTNIGFHNFAALNDTKYIKDSSRFDFDGTKQNAPAVNYFDLLNKFTTAGFHTFPVFKETKYIKDSSEFDWDGSRTNAPAVNYFDLQGTHTTEGFYNFAREYESKYVKESSRFDWDGSRAAAPAVNYFDLPAKFTTTGFHTFAAIRDTKYIPESSEFDWDGLRSASPEVNFFDINKKVTTAGFHRLAEIYDTKYVPEISIFDWDGSRDESPQVNYFDLPGKFTTIGFHRLAEIYDSKYIKDSSEFTFKGKFPEAGIDYFDKEKLNQTGFTLNIQPKGTSKPPGTEYFHESSFYTFKGGRPGNPLESVIDFFANSNQSGFTMDIKRNEGLPETEYVSESSRFDFDGRRPALQSFFPDSNQTGFTLDIMAKGSSRPDTEYNPESSRFDFDGGRPARQSFFPDDNHSGFTIDIMPKGAGNPETEYIAESSRFDFDGLRPVGVNYFPDDNQTGFTIDIMRKGSSRPLTEYSTESSAFTWKGFRTSAPSNNYFGLYRTPIGKQYLDVQQKNNTTQAGRGFQTFYTDKTATNYAAGYSIHSTENGPNQVTIAGSRRPLTNFFGFTPRERAGFLPRMTQSDGTLYPIINPELTYNLDENARLTISTRRASSGVNTVNGEQFAPLSLGKRPWVQQGTLASLENQVPNIITKARAGSYINKYERTMKDTATQGSYLASYGLTQGQIDKQYQEYRGTPLQFDPESPSTPFILRGIQIKGKTINEKWGENTNASNVIFERGGGYSDQFAAINLADKERIEKWLQTPKGTSWKLLQDQLYNNNPLIDSLTAFDSNSSVLPTAQTRVYNEASLLLSIEGNLERGRVLQLRHGGDSDSGPDNYEAVVTKMNPANSDKENVMTFPRSVGSSLYADTIRQAQNNKNFYQFYQYNRLIALMAELLPSSFIPVNSELSSDISNAAAGGGTNIIKRLSGLGGPNSGTSPQGVTEIRRSSHPFMTIYNTSGVLPENYPNTAKRDTWFGPKTKTGKEESANETDFTYAGRMKQQRGLGDGSTFDGLLTALSYLLSGSKFENNTQEYPIADANSGGPQSSAYIQPNVYSIIKARDPFNPKYFDYEDRLRANSVFDSSNIPNTLPSEGRRTLLSGPPSGEQDPNGMIKKYAAVSYQKLKKAPRGDANRLHDYNDFRSDIENEDYKKFSHDPAIVDFKNNNLDTRYGFGKQGKPGAKRDNPYRTNIQYTRDGAKLKSGDGYEFRGDRINIIDYKQTKDIKHLSEVEDMVYERGRFNKGGLSPGEDLITFYFTSVNLKPLKSGQPVDAIVFRAAFDTITDNHKPSWSPVQYMGRGDPTYVFGSYERDVSFGFTVHIGSRDELAASWRKLNALASWTAPDYSFGRMRAPLCRLNIGHLFRKTPGFINSLSYTFDNAGGTWETAKLKEDMNYGNAESRPGALQLPKTIQVAVGFTIIGNYRPERNGAMYSLYDDLGDGLIPPVRSNNALTNYFRVDDEVSSNNSDDILTEPAVVDYERPDSNQDETADIANAEMKRMYGGDKPPFEAVKNDKGEIIEYKATNPKLAAPKEQQDIDNEDLKGFNKNVQDQKDNEAALLKAQADAAAGQSGNTGGSADTKPTGT